MNKSDFITSDDLPFLVKSGALPSGAYVPAMSYLRDPEFWKTWAIRALLALAVGHILSGIIFFFAFNWNDLAPMVKFAVVGGGICASVLAWFIAKLDSPAGQAFGIAATVLVGVMFAVLGQVYQTPALIHTPFVFWALLTLPFALASRNLAHWAVWIAILVVAISTYANSGLRLMGNHAAANWLNIAVSGGFVLGLVALDKVIAPRMKWARAEWFRVLLVVGAAAFAFAGFTESFWGRYIDHNLQSLAWVSAALILGGLLAYLYSLKPTLATLSLTSFGLFALIAQFGFKLFDGFGDAVGIFLLMTLWIGGLTIAMVQLFKHYRDHTAHHRQSKPKDEDDEEEDFGLTRTVEDFASHLALSKNDVTKALASEPDRNTPWYMHTFLAIAGILTALVGCGFVGSFVALILNDASGFVYMAFGLVIFAASLVFRRKAKPLYLQHILNTMIIIGGLIAAVGFGIEAKNFDLIIFVLLALSICVLLLVRDRILEFLAAAAIITLIGIELYHLKVPMAETFILVIATVMGVFCLTRPIGRRLYSAAGTAFLIAPAILGIALVHAHRWDNLAESSRFSDDLTARIISLLVLLGAVAYLNRGKALSDFKPPLLVLIPLVIGAALVPLGGASALLLILAGYILGSRTLAIIGTLLQIYFLTMFYYDLSLDLLTKSIILFVSGLIFLGVWIFVRKESEVTS